MGTFVECVPSSAMNRFFIAVLTAFFVCHASSAFALGIMDPFNIPASFDKGAEVMAENVRFGPDKRHKLDVYAPENLKGSAPVLMFIFGGGWTQGEKDDYKYLGHAMAANGFVTVIADYRLVPEVRFPTFLEDCALAARWIQDNIANYGGDTNRFFLMGHSAGAYNAVMLGFDNSYFQQAGVTMKVRGIAGISGPYDFYPFRYQQVKDAFGHTDNPQLTQPINLLSVSTPPLFLGTGTTDPIVRMVNTQTLANHMREMGLTVIDNYYDGFGHMEPIFAFSTLWRWRLPIMEDVIGFFTDLGAFRSDPLNSVSAEINGQSNAAAAQ